MQLINQAEDIVGVTANDDEIINVEQNDSDCLLKVTNKQRRICIGSLKSKTNRKLEYLSYQALDAYLRPYSDLCSLQRWVG